MTRITLRIDRIVTDQPGIDRQAIERALRAELVRSLATHGPGVLGAGRDLRVVRASLGQSVDPVATRIAAATMRALSPRGGQS